MDELKEESRELVEKKKKLYAEYRKVKEEMREVTAAKANIDYLLGYAEPGRKKEQERKGGENKEQSDADISGQVGPKPGLGRLPNKQIFAFWPEGRNIKNSNCGYSCPACHLAAAPKMAQKTEALILEPPFLWLS